MIRTTVVLVIAMALSTPLLAHAREGYVQDVWIEDSQYAVVYGTITWTSESDAVVDLTVIDAAYDGWCALTFPVAEVVDSRSTAYACGHGTDGSRTWSVHSIDGSLEYHNNVVCGFYPPNSRSDCDVAKGYENPLLWV